MCRGVQRLIGLLPITSFRDDVIGRGCSCATRPPSGVFILDTTHDVASGYLESLHPPTCTCWPRPLVPSVTPSSGTPGHLWRSRMPLPRPGCGWSRQLPQPRSSRYLGAWAPSCLGFLDASKCSLAAVFLENMAASVLTPSRFPVWLGASLEMSFCVSQTLSRESLTRLCSPTSDGTPSRLSEPCISTARKSGIFPGCPNIGPITSYWSCRQTIDPVVLNYFTVTCSDRPSTPQHDCGCQETRHFTLHPAALGRARNLRRRRSSRSRLQRWPSFGRGVACPVSTCLWRQ